MVLYYFFLFALCISKELFEDYYKKAEEYMKDMKLEEKLGQMIFPRFNYKNRTDDIKNKKPGGFVLFAYDFDYNATFIQDYIKEIQNLSDSNVGLPLGLAVDEEGGTVVRVSKYHRPEKFPSPQQIYNESGNDGIAKIDAEKRDLLRKFFLNVNLAPVADISSNSSDYIYDRTIGRNAELSSEYIEKDVEGYVKDNFTCCAKHFPGYGNNIDTHGDIAIDERSYEQFQNEDFLTFEAAIRQKIPMILVSHNIVKCKDDKHPASLSKAWHDVLRNELGFSGLILTDDLSMGAIKKYTDNVSEAVLAVNAGNDILLTSDYYMHYDALIEAVHSGVIKEEVIDTACKRIIAWKFKYLGAKERKPNYTTLIIVSIVLGVLIVGALIVFLILFLKNRKKKALRDENSEEVLVKE
jgi:beta-N-acetylhexosaminidase